MKFKKKSFPKKHVKVNKKISLSKFELEDDDDIIYYLDLTNTFDKLDAIVKKASEHPVLVHYKESGEVSIESFFIDKRIEYFVLSMAIGKILEDLKFNKKRQKNLSNYYLILCMTYMKEIY